MIFLFSFTLDDYELILGRFKNGTAEQNNLEYVFAYSCVANESLH